MLSNPSTIKAVGKGSASARAISSKEYLEDELADENKLSETEEAFKNAVDNTNTKFAENYVNYQNKDTGKLVFKGNLARKLGIEGNECTTENLENMIKGKLHIDGTKGIKPRKRLIFNDDKTPKLDANGKQISDVVYDYTNDMVYSSNKYLSTMKAVGDVESKYIADLVHKSGSETIDELLQENLVVRKWDNNLKQQVFEPIEGFQMASAVHNKSRSETINLHTHKIISMVVLTKSGDFKVADESLIKNATNRL